MKKQMSEQIERDHAAYIGLRHFKPDAVRMIRLGLDNGVEFKFTPAKMRRMGLSADEQEMFKSALRYMREHPEAGRIRIVDGDDHYTFVELDAGVPQSAGAESAS